ncbi:hypothetical protein LCGC14_2064900 [marine sediment metagenome]|uniref:Uncharacterized protein n=1 Tax=marine sediment metagenome TaxID=412755 RepID=A0A0F9EK01_9ZZZZ
MVKKQRRKPAVQLVCGTKETGARSINWYQRLCDADQLYVRDVVSEAVAAPDAAPYLIAKALTEELSINRSVGTVARTLREMIRNAQ